MRTLILYLIKLIVFIIKKCKLVGLLSILLLVEICYLQWYTNDELYSIKSEKNNATVEAVLTGKGVNDEGKVGYCFDIKIVNTGDEEIEAIVGYKGQDDKYLKYDYVSEYQDMDITDSWRNELMKGKDIPPGTEITLKYFISEQQLNKMEGDYLIFRDGIGQNYTYILMEDLKNSGKGGK